ncbi:MAG TPA: peptide deformylase [Nitriliruptoraceae bacterium]|nr:peptide deformylase [Nitriliruptoraceae bacterium]
MTRLDIRLFGDPVLRQQARTVTDFDDRLATLARNMHETMAAASGVGLAANQVGVLKRLFTWSDGEDDGLRGAVANPRLLDASEEVQEGDEGCLSFPGLFYPLDRPLRVQVAWQDLSGDGHEVELEGFLARVWLHEMDHLDGVLFIDHLARHDRKAAMRAMRQLRDEETGGDTRTRPGSLLLGSRRDGDAL